MTTENTATTDHTATAPYEAYERGLGIRREVLGDAHVERSLAGVTEFTKPIQELVTAYCWGEVWSRPGIDRKTRSLVNLAMLTALNRNHELGVHVRGAVNNGCTPDEIREVLIQTAIYVGVPASLESFRVADQVITEMQQDD